MNREHYPSFSFKKVAPPTPNCAASGPDASAPLLRDYIPGFRANKVVQSSHLLVLHQLALVGQLLSQDCGIDWRLLRAHQSTAMQRSVCLDACKEAAVHLRLDARKLCA
eukprot:1159066-Pelagomonas_calceolata.AAC.4